MGLYKQAINEQDYEMAGKLFRQYANWLNIDLSFQHFDEELKELKMMYAAPKGCIILFESADSISGCVAIRKIDDRIAELKRMYVTPSLQNKGVGSGLLNEALFFARNAGYKKVRLDTLSHMTSAMNLYKKNGFYEIPAYYNNPESNAVFFEITLISSSCFRVIEK